MKIPHVRSFVLIGMLSVFATACAQAPAASAQTPPAAPAPPQKQQQWPEARNVNSDAKLIADFKAKVDDYVKMRKSLEGPASTPKQTEDPKALLDAQKTLAAKVRAARPTAKRGDFFTPATAEQFKRLLNPSVKGPDGPENKVAIKDDAPEPKDVPFQVNAEYPRDESLSTVPPDILRSLPQLPPDIQYRFVGRHMILYDAKPNIILDFMLNALPPLPQVEKKN